MGMFYFIWDARGEIMAKKNEVFTWKEDPNQAEIQQKSMIIETYDEHLDTFVQQNSPVNNEMIRNTFVNELFRQEITGQMAIVPTEVTVREHHGNAPAVYALCAFSYVDNVDLEAFNKNGRYKITAYDRRVYNAISTLYLNNRKTVTLTEIFSVMNGYIRTNPSSTQLAAIEKSLVKFGNIRMYIDLTAEVKANIIKDKDALVKAGVLKNRSDKIKSAVIEDAMLHYRIGTITSEQGKVYKSIHIVDEPSLLTYNRAKGTLLSIPMEYIGLQNTNATEKAIAFQDYLLMRIISYRKGKLKESKCLFSTIYRDSGISMPDDKTSIHRDRDLIRKILEEWKEKGLIADYSDIMSGRSCTGIQFKIK